MTEYTYTVNMDTITVYDSLTLNQGDSLMIYGYSDISKNYEMGLWSVSTDPSGLIGDYPLELPKTSTYFQHVRTSNKKAFYFVNSVVLNTMGTYTFRKGAHVGSTSTAYGLLTVTVLGGSSSTIPVNVSGTWKEATPYVNVSGTWKEAKPYINVGGTWKETN